MMKKAARNELLKSAFSAALDSQPAVDGPHIAVDTELLSRWSTGDLTEDEHASLLDHLAECNACRREIARMMQIGEIHLSEVVEDDSQAEPVTTVADFDGSQISNTRIAWTALVLAASVIIAAWLLQTPHQEDAFLLAQVDPLGEFEALLSGTAVKGANGLPLLDPEVQKRDEDFRQSLVESPDDVAILINYGQFLLEQRRFDRAEEQFQLAWELGSYRALAEFGLGLVDFHKGRKGDTSRFKFAIQHFNSVIQQDSQNINAHIYAALCLEELQGSTVKAIDHLERAKELLDDKALQQKVSSYIEQLGVEDHD